MKYMPMIWNMNDMWNEKLIDMKRVIMAKLSAIREERIICESWEAWSEGILKRNNREEKANEREEKYPLKRNVEEKKWLLWKLMKRESLSMSNQKKMKKEKRNYCQWNSILTESRRNGYILNEISWNW